MVSSILASSCEIFDGLSRSLKLRSFEQRLEFSSSDIMNMITVTVPKFVTCTASQARHDRVLNFTCPLAIYNNDCPNTATAPTSHHCTLKFVATHCTMTQQCENSACGVSPGRRGDSTSTRRPAIPSDPLGPSAAWTRSLLRSTL